MTKDNDEIRDLDADTSARLARALQEVEDQLKAAGYTQVTHVLEFFAKTLPVDAPLSATIRARGAARNAKRKTPALR